ncbi:DUF3757 domain-containing protein [Xanthomonas axonopodis pv. poinsettiicola]|uniref:DUF3757 domain-containing protein n=1 Tax=Xanthomonas TaxID=338 RepID=UPI001E47BD05|nr:DUF3757 domain-containing protein [Xanthomonas codiaei]MCC8538720.1 DUF3757 domain-containing protein [Xanthomonas codiaei]
MAPPVRAPRQSGRSARYRRAQQRVDTSLCAPLRPMRRALTAKVAFIGHPLHTAAACPKVRHMIRPLTPLILAGMLLPPAAASASGKQPAQDLARCPAPETVHYQAGRYRAPVRLDVGSGNGVWASTLQPNAGSPRHLSSALYYGTLAAAAPSTGVLVNCSYTLRAGTQVDLAYFDRQTPQTQRNLIVTLQDPSRWQLDEETPAPGREQFYACPRGGEIRSAADCAFEPLRLE